MAVISMGADAAAAALPSDLRHRLAATVELEPDLIAPDPPAPYAPDALARTEILLTGWGTPPLDATALDRAPRLRAVVHAAGSVKQHLSPEVWERGIAVSSAADANAAPVADFTCAAITLAAKRALSSAARYETGRPSLADRQGADGRTIGIIGASRIGRLVIARLAAHDAEFRILLTDPYLSTADAQALGTELVSPDELCRRSSIVSIHAPQLPETHHLLNAHRLSLIPDGGTVINTARGSLVDTDALTRECATGRLDACLDVTDPDPLPAGHPLLALRNVLVTPHIAGAQGSEVRRLGAYAVAEVERLVHGRPLLGRVTAADLPRMA
ncbi:hydroxyacid dehydrogenase [Streptomyces sp. NPDC002055]|uniref:hydroxyacid dehydrogenase n=1 Tax=Streptomyces sp. NPDC002055 TaxID=3154534 RepID=UPI00331A0A96